MSNSQQAQDKRAYIFALTAVLMWSTVAIAFKVGLRELAPVQLLLWAAMFSIMTLMLTVTVQKKWFHVRMLTAAQWRASVLYGALNPVLYYVVLFAAYDLLPAQEAQALNYSWALTLAFLSVPFLGQKLRAQDLLAGCVCYGGVLVIATRGNPLGLEFSHLPGVGLALFSTLIWAGYWIVNTKDQREPVVGLMLNFIMALPILLFINSYQGLLLLPSYQSLAAAAYIGIFEMGLAFACWLTAMRLTSQTAKISNLIFLSPFISLILIYFLLGEEIYPSTLVGLGFIISGLLIQQYKTAAQKAALKALSS
ncbi:DMT family transporter [Oceanospirillum linum]|uniref:EamA family transporter n=1 Tax=Oceanospirillum linum TaxID=966 RepID=A0A1T1HG11_OCELI|nr:DMT family transporter [Oceanospirillum linum]OOV88657.1 EamA family transporter [Oceanospirillum linum]SEG03725.1 hypothetical protein SAMN04489856_104184 [Oleiphilus messinensis]SMP21159.1 hypothetical protein SAMN06264348_10475 [Oceanospirillum linum]